MNDKQATQDTFRTLQLMNEIESGETVSQRELAGRLGVAVGLVNSYLKNFVSKGFVRVQNYPRNRYAYLLTPKGLTEKSRLAFQHFNYFTGLYTNTRRQYMELFQRLKVQQSSEVSFCGIDEVAEIAYLSLQEAGLTLAAVMDDGQERRELFGHPIVSLAEAVGGKGQTGRPIVITSLKRRDHLVGELSRLGVNAADLYLLEQL